VPLFDGAGVIVCGDDEPMPVVLLGGVTVREAVFVCTQTFSAKVNLQLPRDVPTTVVIIAALGWSKRTWHEPPAERYQFSPAIALETTNCGLNGGTFGGHRLLKKILRSASAFRV
jgi:hypothetical protein